VIPASHVGRPSMATSEGVAMPEFLTRRDIETGSWIVGEGTPTRGDAWTNLNDRHMRVPFGDSDLARVIRAHEMAHAKTSPIDMQAAVDACSGIDANIVAACEEVRVNEMIKLAGFDIDLLTDGSEKMTGVQLAKMGRAGWNGVVQMVTATANTKAANSLIAGIRSVDPDMAKAAGELRKAIRKFVASKKRHTRNYGEAIGSTRPYDDGINYGFAHFTKELASLVDGFTIATENEIIDGSLDDGEPQDSLEEIAKRANGGERGQWAKLIIDQIPLTRSLDGKLGRKRVASDIGRNPRRIQRLLTDPEKRVFDRRSRGKGGVVLIDQSGSMRLSIDDVMSIVEAAPGCIIIGYSHRAGSTGVPNAWILANRGKVVEEIREGNGGNGVDGPALRLALSHRRSSEPIVWVCDGMVTDGRSDSTYLNLERECAAMVNRHGVHMVGGVEEAIEALNRAGRGERLPARLIGRLRFAAPAATSEAA
jgi:hypothetical protein